MSTEDQGSPPADAAPMEQNEGAPNEPSPDSLSPAAAKPCWEELPEPASILEDEFSELKEALSGADKKNQELTEKLNETHQRMLRAAADLDNYRKRSLKDREENRKFGGEKLLKDFLPILDNLERALEHAKNSQDFESLREGVAMTRKLFEDTLAKHGVTPVTSVGQAFDPHLHDALQHIETAELAPNHVFSEVVKGYLLHDRLMRPALVVVSKEPKAKIEGEENEGSPTFELESDGPNDEAEAASSD